MLGEFQNGYKRSGRFHIDVDEGSGKYDLLVNDAQSSDAGTYTCIDEEGLGARGDAELIVLGKQCNILEGHQFTRVS